jgi:hypothetical protein
LSSWSCWAWHRVYGRESFLMYSEPKTVLQQKLRDTLDVKASALVSDLIKLSLMKLAEKDENLLIYTEIYNLLGIEKFTELISLVNGRPLVLPSKEDFKDTINTVLCYYYRTVEGKDWDEIKQLLADPDLNTIKYGIRATTFADFINVMIGRIK